jgi:hypothetical protein
MEHLTQCSWCFGRHIIIIIIIIIVVNIQLFVGPWPLFQFHNQYTVCRTPWMGDQPWHGAMLESLNNI